MREPGWYWAKDSLGDWLVVEISGGGVYYRAGNENTFTYEDFIYVSRRKIEEPKEME